MTTYSTTGLTTPILLWYCYPEVSVSKQQPQDKRSGRGRCGTWWPMNAHFSCPAISTDLSVCCGVKQLQSVDPADWLWVWNWSLYSSSSRLLSLTTIHFLNSILQLLHTANNKKWGSRNRKCLRCAHHCADDCSDPKVKKWCRRRLRRDCPLGDAMIRTTIRFSHWPLAGK